MYIYILYGYDEWGPTNLKVTTDRERIIDLVESYNSDGWFERCESDPIEPVKKLLTKTDGELASAGAGDDIGTHRLMHGWGGLCLHVVEES